MQRLASNVLAAVLLGLTLLYGTTAFAAPGDPPLLVAAASRKVHGAAGTFEIPLALGTTNPSTEPRSGGTGGNHTLVFVFDKPVTGGTVSISEGTATPGVATFAGNEMTVPLSGVTNQQYVTVDVSAVAAEDGGTGGFGTVRVGFLLGDVNQNRVVTLSDLGQVNAQIAQFVTAANFLKDVNVSGTLSLADKGFTNGQLTRALPPIPICDAVGCSIFNGSLQTGAISVAGEIDTYFFSANAGDRIAVHIGEIVDNNDYRPWILLKAPDGAVIGERSGADAAAIDGAVATTTGTHLVLVGSFDSGFDGTGTYRLTTAWTPGPITVSPGDQGGPLTNGATHFGEILQGDLDVWTFTATAGDRIAVHIGQVSETDDFRPWIRVWAPNGANLGSASGTDAAVLDGISAPVTGTYLVLVGSFDSGFDGTGTYALTMAKTAGAITVSDGDQGGPLTNGGMHTGEIFKGDLDVWTFDATAGDRIGVHIGEITDNDDFRPWIRVWAPNGANLGSASGTDAAVLDAIAAPVTGTYLVLVGSFDSGFDGSGTYRLTMTKTPGPITVSPGDEGGALTNGGTHTGTIDKGDLDVWTFTAAVGDRIGVHIGEITDNDDFRPWIRLWAPNGTVLASQSGVGAAVIDGANAPVAGTYLVLVGSFDSGFDGTGTYALTMTKTPGPVTVSAGDDGGPMTNGATHTGAIFKGDLDVWTFDAVAGDRIGLHIGEITDNDDFRPWIRLWAPNGTNLGSQSGVAAAVIDGATAPVTGTYSVLVSSFDSAFDGTGTYALTLAKTPGPVTVSAGDEGGDLGIGGTVTGAIANGDVDVWTIDLHAGYQLNVTINETSETDDFRPWIRVWAPDGTNLGSQSGLTTAHIGPTIVSDTGTYLILVSSFDSGFNGAGTYSLTVTATIAP